MEPEAFDPIGVEHYKISTDPDSRRCGFAGCKRWIKKDGHCAPCSAIKIQNAIEIKEWNFGVQVDRSTATPTGGAQLREPLVLKSEQSGAMKRRGATV